MRAVRDVRAVRAVGAGGAGGRAGAAIEHYFLFFCVSSEYGSMWAVGAVGVLEERNACGRWVWGEGGKRACGGGGEGGGGGVRAVRDVRAVRAVREWGSNRTLFSLLFFVSSEYGSMWPVWAVGVLEERNACGRWVWGEGERACGGGGEGGGFAVRAVR